MKVKTGFILMGLMFVCAIGLSALWGIEAQNKKVKDNMQAQIDSLKARLIPLEEGTKPCFIDTDAWGEIDTMNFQKMMGKRDDR
jgi:hypothetical protein